MRALAGNNLARARRRDAADVAQLGRCVAAIGTVADDRAAPLKRVAHLRQRDSSKRRTRSRRFKNSLLQRRAVRASQFFVIDREDDNVRCGAAALVVGNVVVVGKYIG